MIDVWPPSLPTRKMIISTRKKNNNQMAQRKKKKKSNKPFAIYNNRIEFITGNTIQLIFRVNVTLAGFDASFVFPSCMN